MVYGMIRLDLNISAFIKIYWPIGFQSLEVCLCNRQLCHALKMGTWIAVLVLFNTKLIKYRMRKPWLPFNQLISLLKMFHLRISTVSQTENFFILAHLKNMQVGVTQYAPILDCFLMWKIIASTKSGSRDKIHLLSIFLATCELKSTKLEHRIL